MPNTLIRWFLRINRLELETVCLQMTDVIGHLRSESHSLTSRVVSLTVPKDAWHAPLCHDGPTAFGPTQCTGFLDRSVGVIHQKRQAKRCRQWCRGAGIGAVQLASICIALHQFAVLSHGIAADRAVSKLRHMNRNSIICSTALCGRSGTRTTSRPPKLKQVPFDRVASGR